MVKDTVTISVEGTTHRSIELRVQSTVNDSSLKIRLFRTLNSADTLAAEYPILVTDTTIIDDNNGEGLQLNTEYTYFTVTIDTAGDIKDTSNLIPVKPSPQPRITTPGRNLQLVISAVLSMMSGKLMRIMCMRWVTCLI